MSNVGVPLALSRANDPSRLVGFRILVPTLPSMGCRVCSRLSCVIQWISMCISHTWMNGGKENLCYLVKMFAAANLFLEEGAFSTSAVPQLGANGYCCDLSLEQIVDAAVVKACGNCNLLTRSGFALPQRMRAVLRDNSGQIVFQLLNVFNADLRGGNQFLALVRKLTHLLDEEEVAPKTPC